MAGIQIDTFKNIKNQQAKQDYKSRLEVIRNPGVNHMSRTRTKIDRFTKKSDGKGGTGGGGRRKKKAYAGAYVAEPRRQKPSGFSLAGRLMPHIHDFVIDMDLSSLYPSIMLLCNLAPTTFVVKFMLQDDFQIPMYQIQFLDRDEKADYKQSQNDFYMEAYSGKHWWAIFEIFFAMKTGTQIMDYIEDRMKDFV